MSRIFSSQWRDRKTSECYDPFPVHTLKRVDRPTTVINEHLIQRPDQREHGFSRAARGDFGPFVAKEQPRFVAKQPLSGALVTMSGILAHMVDEEKRLLDGPFAKLGAMLHPTAASKAPGTDDP